VTDLTINDSPRIVAVLNCYAPDGANRGQVIVKADGTVTHHGESSLSNAAITMLRKRRGLLAKAA
jgi:hypothetical protein